MATGEIFLAATAMQQLSPSVIYERPTGATRRPTATTREPQCFSSCSLSLSQFKVYCFLDNAMYLEGFYLEIKINFIILSSFSEEKMEKIVIVEDFI